MNYIGKAVQDQITLSSKVCIFGTGMKHNPDVEQSMWEGLSDIGGFRPNLSQPSRIVLRMNLTESDGEDVLSLTTHMV
jgi:hypothetical protein